MKTQTMSAKASTRRILTGCITAACAAAFLGSPAAHAATYYWDNLAGAGFGTAGGTWSALTAGPIPGWNTDVTGATAPGSITTAMTDVLNFGTGTVGQGLAAGTITVDTVDSGTITFGSQSGAIVLSGGTINLSDAATITVNNSTDTINSVLAGAATSITKAGAGTLLLTGVNTYTGTTILNGGTLTVGNGATGSLNGTTGTALTFTGTGTFNVAEAASSTQGMGVLSFSAGAGNITSTAAGAGSTATLTFGSMAARVAGATGNFSLATNTTASQNTIVLTSTANAPLNNSGSNDRGLFFGGTEFARYDTTNGYFRAVTYGTDINALAVKVSAATLGAVDATKDVKISGNITAQTTALVNTLNLAGSNLTFSNAANVFSVNGIIATGANVMANTTTVSKLQTTAAGGEMVINVAGTSLSIAPIIQNNAGGATASALTKSGTGTLTLSAANTYSGATTISAGILKIGNTTALGTGTGTADGTTISAGATLDLGGVSNVQNSSIGAERITVSGAGMGGNGAIISSTAIATPFIGVRYVTLAGDTTLGFANRWDVGSTTAANNGFVGGGFNLTFLGTAAAAQASLNFLGATDLGDINVNLGGVAATNILFLQGTTTLGRTTNTVTITGGSTLNIFTNSTVTSFDKKFALNNGIIVVQKTGGTSLDGTISLANANTITATTATAVTNIISGTGSLIKAGAGTLTLTGANTYAGNTTLSAGTINLNVAESANVSGPLGKQLANAPGTILMTGGILQYSASNANDYSGRFSIAGSQAWKIDTNSQAVTFATALQGTSSTLAKSGAGTLNLTGANTYDGGTSISAGTLQFANLLSMPVAGAVTATASTLAVNVGGAGEWTTGTSGNGTIGGLLTGLGGQSGGTVTWSGNSFLGLDTTNAGSTQTYSGNIANTGTSLGITKLGTGALALAGTNTYTGNTVVSGGTLNITGTLTGNNTSSTLAYGGTGANTVVNVSNDVTLYAITGANNAGSVAVYNQTAGTVTTTNAVQFGDFVANSGGYGYFNLTGGTFQNTQGSFDITNNTSTASTGVAYVAGNLDLSASTGNMVVAYSASSIGSLTVVPGGMLNYSGSTAQFFLTVSANSYGVLNVAGGNVDLGTRLVRVGNAGAGQTGILNLAGGTFTLGQNVSTLATTSNFYANYAGGTFKAAANLTSPFTTSSGLTVTSTIFGPISNSAAIGNTSQNFTGGLTVDTNGNSVTYGNALLGATGNGVAQTNITVSGGSGYIGAPAVTFTGGTVAANGTPASGYAVISGGAVTGIVITSPGEYTVDPAVTLTGGGGTGASVALSALGANATDTGLTKIGNGTLTLTAANTYQGATRITGGTLTLSGSGTINSSSGITINGSGTKFLQTSSVAGTSAITLTQGTLTGSGAVGAVDVANTATAIISNNDGVAGASLTTGALTFNGAATVNLFSSSTSAPLVAAALSSNLAGIVTINPTSTIWTNGSTYDLISYTGGSIGNAGFGQFALGAVTGLNSRQSVSGLGNSGTAVTLTISGFDTIWTGIQSSEWSLNTITPLKNWTLSGGGGDTDFVTSDAVFFNNSPSNKTVDISNGNVLPSPNIVTFTNTVGAANDYTLQGANGITGMAALNKTGSGIVTINNTNSFTGGTNITDGTLVLGHATDTLADTGAVTVDGATAVLSIGANSDTVGAVFLKNGASITGSGGILTGSSYTMESGSISAILGGPGIVLNKSTGGTVTLSGANTYTGATNIIGGTLKLTGAGTLASSSGVLLSAGATLDLNGTNQTITLGASAGTIANNSGSGTSVLTFNGSANAGSPLIVDSTSNAGGNVAVVVTTSSQTFNPVNTYSGGTTVNGGAFLYIGAAGTSAGTGGINLTASNSGLVANGITIANDISGAGYISNNVNGAATVTLTGTLNTSGSLTSRNASNVYNFAGSGNSTLSGSIGAGGGTNGTAGRGSIIMSGSGILTLSGANIYTGGTTINAGILNVNADAALGASTGALAINNGATLQAGGTVTTARTVMLGGTGGVIDTTSNIVTLGTTSTVTGTVLTKIGAGTLNLAGTQTYATLTTSNGTTNVNSALGTGSSTVNANATTNFSVSQTLAELNIGAGAVVTLGSGGFAPEPGDAPDFAFEDGAAGLPAAVAAVPEPGSVGLLLLGALGLLARCRHRALNDALAVR